MAINDHHATVSAVVWLALCVPAAPAGAGALRATFAVGKGIYVTGEPVMLEASLVNAGRVDMAAYIPDQDQAGWTFTVTREGEARRLEPARQGASGGLTPATVLKPGQRKVVRKILNRAIPLDRPGDYTVSCRLALLSAERVPDRPAQAPVAVTLEGTVRFRVRAAEEGDLDGVIKRTALQLRERDPAVRGRACDLLGAIPSRAAAKHLATALNDAREAVRIRAVKALEGLGAPLGAEGLLKALGNQSSSVREAAVYALGRTKARGAADPLRAALADAKASVRFAAMYALVAVEGKAAVTSLKPMLNDADADVRRSASQLLRGLEKR